MVTKTEGPFEYYSEIHAGVTGDSIRSSAAQPKQNAAAIAALASELEGDEKKVATQIQGAAAKGTAANPRKPAASARDLAAKGTYAVALLHQFAGYVDTFDTEVNRLNVLLKKTVDQRVASITSSAGPHDPIDRGALEAQVKSELMGKYKAALTKLDDDADDIAAKFKQGPTAKNVTELVRAGLMSLGAAKMFPKVHLSQDDKVAWYKASVKNGTVPDFSKLSESEQQDYLSKHPGISDVVPALLAVKKPDASMQSLFKAQVKHDSDLITKALKGEPGSTTLAEVDRATKILAAINDRIAHGGKMSASEAGYISAFTTGVGASNLTKLPELVTKSVYKSQLPPSVTQNDITKHLSPISSAILNYSNPKVQQDGVVDTNGDGKVSLDEMPPVVKQLTTMRIGEQDNGDDATGGRVGDLGDEDHPWDSIKNLDAFKGWSDLMASAPKSVEGGDQFSQDLAHEAIHAKQDMNAILGTASGADHHPTAGGDYESHLDELKGMLDDRYASQLLSTASHNENASAAMLNNDTDRRTLLGMNWDWGEGAGDVIRSGTDRDPADGGGTEAQAKAMLAVMKEIGSDPKTYDAHANEQVSDAVIDSAIQWRDTFGSDGLQEGTVTNGEDPLGHKIPLKINLSSEDQAQFLRFVSGSGEDGDDSDPIRFQAAVKSYGNSLILRAMDSGDHEDVRHAMEWSGRADGRIGAADVDWATDQYEDANAKKAAEIVAHNRAMASDSAAAKVLTTIGTTAAGAVFPPAAPFLSIGGGSANIAVWDQVFHQDTVPDFDHMNADQRATLVQQDKENAEFERDYRLGALNAAAHKGDPDYSALFHADGTLKSAQEVRDYDGAKGDGPTQMNGLADSLLDDYNNKHPNQPAVSIDDTYVHQRDLTAGRGTVDQDRTNTDSWADHEHARDMLYGDNWDNFKKDWEERLMYPVSRAWYPVDQDYDPYPYDPRKITD